MLYYFFKLIIFFLLKVFFRFEVRGRDAIPRDVSFILASNHLSNLDPLVLGAAVRPRLYFLAKQELFSNIFSSALLKNIGAIPLKRKRLDISALRTAISILNSNKALVIFPQGRREKVLNKPLAGVGFLFKKTHVPIVVAKIFGTDRVLPKGSKILRLHRISIVFRRLRIFQENDSYKTIAYKVWESIQNI